MDQHEITLTSAINVANRLKTDNAMPYDFPASDYR
jgi:hypothetical protein